MLNFYQNDGSHRITNASLALSCFGVLAAFVALPAFPTTAALIPPDRLQAPDRVPGQHDSFGSALAASGNRLLIGAATATLHETHSGGAYLMNLETGTLSAPFASSRVGARSEFGVSAAMDGHLAVIGATNTSIDLVTLQHLPDTRRRQYATAAAFVFDLDTGEELSVILGNGRHASDEGFARDVAISGTTVAIAAYGANDGEGLVHIVDALTGEERFTLALEDTVNYAGFGRSIAIDNDLAIVSAFVTTEEAGGSGGVFMFDMNTGEKIGQLVQEDPHFRDSFGAAVAIRGQTAIVGAPGRDFIGAAYIFDLESGEQIGELTPTGYETGILANTSRFGASIAIDESGKYAIVGTPDEYNQTTGVGGTAYIFDLETGEQVARMTPDSVALKVRFGGEVAITDSIAAIGLQLFVEQNNPFGLPGTIALAPLPEPSALTCVVLLGVLAGGRRHRLAV